MNDLLEVIASGLTYEGNLLHSLINYGLIVITIAPFVVSANLSHTHAGQRWIGCLLIGLAVQILLWFSVDAVGVSVVWCTMTGYNLLVRTAHAKVLAPDQRRLLTFALVSALVGIVYYGLTFPPITTIAHGLAVVIGIRIFYLFRTVWPSSKPKA